jgi:hypothetical protein
VAQADSPPPTAGPQTTLAIVKASKAAKPSTKAAGKAD